VFSSHLCVPHISLCQHDEDDDDAHISSQCIVCEKNLVRVTSLQAHAAEGCAICVSLLIHYEGHSKSFATQYDAQMTQAKFLCYYST